MPGEKTPTDPAPSAICPFCRKRKRITVAGRFVLHVIVGRWSRSMCRGSGAIALPPKWDTADTKAVRIGLLSVIWL